MEVVTASGHSCDGALFSEWVCPVSSGSLTEALWLERKDGMKLCGGCVTFQEVTAQRPLRFFLPASSRVQDDIQLHRNCLLVLAAGFFLMYRHWGNRLVNKWLLIKQEDLSLDLQQPHTKLGAMVHTYKPDTGRQW